jgi:hypothetical protein
MSIRNIPGGKGRQAQKADNLTAICEPISRMGNYTYIYSQILLILFLKSWKYFSSVYVFILPFISTKLQTNV